MGKQLVLCFDGTNNQFGLQNTNVVKLFEMLTKNSDEQKVYYQTGIGTYDLDGVSTKLGLLVDSAIGVNMKDHVLGGYKFLMQQYRAGDDISLFGFSRGAVTARTLASMLYIVGLLPEDNEEHIPFAWTVFEQSHGEINEKGKKRFFSLNFKRTFAMDVNVKFLGLWDTVVGVAPVKLSRYNPIVNYVRHALALDETRDRFQPHPWGPPLSKEEEKKEAFRENESSNNTLAIQAARVGGNTAKVASIMTVGRAGGLSTEQNSNPERAPRNVKEVWFAGNHSDVGGGNTDYDAPEILSNIPLRWMVREALLNTQILFESSVLDAYKIKLYQDMEDPVVLQDHRKRETDDAIQGPRSPYDGLLGAFYTVTEFLPKYRTDGRGWLPNMFKSRSSLKSTANSRTLIHSSVLLRLDPKLKSSDPTAPSHNPETWGDNVGIADEWILDDNQYTRTKAILDNYGVPERPLQSSSFVKAR